MKMFRPLLAILAIITWSSGVAFADPPFAAWGHYTDNGHAVALNHVVAVHLDNAEGLLEPNVRMRLVMSDREVAETAVMGIAFPPVRDMARRGEVRGVLLEFDPRDQTRIAVTVLNQPADPEQFLTTTTLSDSGGLWLKLTSNAHRISGQITSKANPDFELVFDAPVIDDPVIANLIGADAQKSVFVQQLRARAQALLKGDMVAFAALSSHNAAALQSTPPPVKNPQFQAQIAAQIKSFDHVQRIVVRGVTATVLLPEQSWESFVKEDGAWKIAD